MRAWYLAPIFAVLFAVLVWVVMPSGHPVTIDLAVARWVGEARTDAGVAFFTGVSFAGSLLGIVPLAGALMWWLYRRRGGWAPVAWLGITMAGASALYLAVNVPFGRPRPPLPLRVYEDAAWSFPSGHSTQAAAFWIMAATLATAGASRRMVLASRAIAVGMIALIGFSRVYLCAHWTTDVLAGIALGTAWVAVMLEVRARRGAPWRVTAVT